MVLAPIPHSPLPTPHSPLPTPDALLMISNFFIRRPIVAMVIAIVTVLAGLIAMRRLPLAQFPEIVPPQIIASTTYTGADAITIEQWVSTPLEQQMNGVDNMLYMQSTNANDGTQQLTVTFNWPRLETAALRHVWKEKTMRLLVLGATGGTGQEIVRQAIERGHAVTAFVRSPDRLKPFKDRITIKQGDLLNSAELEQAIRGHDAVLSAFGPRVPISKADANLLQRFALALTSAMPQAGVRRVIVESFAFLFKTGVLPPAYLFGRMLFPSVVADSSAMEELLRKSGLDWTIVRPPELKDKPYTGKYRAREGHLPLFGFSISRANVADFMLKAVENRSSIGKIVGISN